MIAKITVSGNNRNEALARLLNALRITHIAGTTTNLAFLQALANQAEFRAGVMDTGLIDRQLAKLAAGQEDTALHRLLGCFLIAQKQSADTENFVPHSWRLWGAGSHRVKLQVDDGFVIHRLTVEGDGAISLLLDEDDATECVRIQVQTLNASCIVYQRDNQTHTANYVMWETNGVRHLSLHHAGEVHVYRAPDPLAVATQVAANADSISAPMTGVIKAINTQVGAAVKAGDVLLVLEAMKMETTLTAPRDGVVQAVHVALEESVHDAATLITLETDIV